MRLYVTSDWHLEEQPLWTFPAEMPDFDVAVIAGDLERGIVAAIRQIRSAPALKDKPVVFVPGNHDFDEAVFQDVIAEGLAFAAEYPNIHVLHRRSITIAGVRFVGATLWTDYALYGPARTKPSMVWAGQMMPDHTSIKYREDTGHISRFMPGHARAEHKRDRAFIEETVRMGPGRHPRPRPGRRAHKNPLPVLGADAVGVAGAQVGVEALAQGVGQHLAHQMDGQPGGPEV